MTKTALITGCSSGIGKSLAKAMLGAGYRVYASARNLDTLADLISIGAQGIALDVTQEASIQHAMNTIRDNGDTVDILVNNAGYGAMGPVAEMPDSELERQFKTNVFGPIALIRAVVPEMKEKKSGLIVNIGSVSGIMVTPFSGVYCATKAALHAVSDALRMELAPFHIDVLTVQPGAIESEFGNSAEASLDKTLPADSLYNDFRASILKRARMSQNNPTSADDFVKELLRAIERPKKNAVITIGNGSTLLPLMARWLPTRLRDNMLKKTFGLTHQK